MPPYIRWLKSKQVGQFIRQEGPGHHQVKAHTPTMGGLCFMTTSTLSACLWWWYAGTWNFMGLCVLVAAILCGLIGFSDDLAKVLKRNNAGLSAWLRLALEGSVGAGLGWLLILSGTNPQIILPGVTLGDIHVYNGGILELHWLTYILLAVFLVAATANAVNLHDGMDGLAAGTSVQVLTVIGVVLFNAGQLSLAVVAAGTAGSLVAFLWFNRYPASIFMGDSGSLFLGGLMASLVLAGGIVVWFVLLSLIYISETLSVIIQVVYFKLTKEYQTERSMSRLAVLWLKLSKRLTGEGKRFFRMAPLHHHFEAVLAERGVAEWVVVSLFWLVQFALCLIVLASLRIL
ncbi:MAG: phospho-N-acetylmuramoyl-pentapeptide-transferase [Candidatus Melainabacteria bacterium]|nr:phospho-N-acetylmuramoyl-pentapeptide-transferase [Candidatus Melainabacteria bacterium]